MAAKITRNKINFKGKTVSIGIDMHKRSWHITALANGEIVLTVTLSKPNYDAFQKVLSQFKGNCVRIVYEAGPGGFDLYDRLTADGIECIVTPPSLIPTQSGSRVKTDKKDSLKLAKLLESNTGRTSRWPKPPVLILVRMALSFRLKRSSLKG